MSKRRQATENIQVDMFDVQLGAALLMQFRTKDGEVVRVLADAGVDPRSRYKQDHVLRPIEQAMADFGSGRRIDLVIGTHYDADHLEGLIPIIRDRNITITEAWLPPVANDAESHALEDLPQERQLLPKQLEAENGDDVLRSYFNAKRRACEELRSLQRAAEEFAHDQSTERQQVYRRRWPDESRGLDDWVDHERELFKRHFDEAAAIAHDNSESHADDSIEPPPDLFPQGYATSYRVLNPERISPYEDHWLSLTDDEGLRAHWKRRGDRAAVDARGLALIRQSTAKDAINAASLYRVVVELQQEEHSD